MNHELEKTLLQLLKLNNQLPTEVRKGLSANVIFRGAYKDSFELTISLEYDGIIVEKEDLFNYISKHEIPENIRLSSNYKSFNMNFFEEACKNGHIDIIKFFIPLGEYSSKYDDGLREACGEGQYEVAKLLVKNGADPTAGIIRASKNGHYEIVRFLVENDADVTTQDNASIEVACEHGHRKIVEYLYEHGADLKPIYLVKAAGNGHLEVVKYLNEHIKDMNYAACALAEAARNGHLEVVKYLNEHGANPAKYRIGTHNFDNEALCGACANGHYKVVEYLLKQPEVDINADFGRPYREAKMNRHFEIVELLLKNGADSDSQKKFDQFLREDELSFYRTLG